MKKCFTRAWLGLVALAATIAVAQSSPAVVVDGAYVRKPPGVDVAAVYLNLRNTGLQPLIVIGVSSPAAGHAMLHETSTAQGRSKMRPRDKVVIAPGQTVSFAPGGLHIMLSGLKRNVAIGQTVPLVLLLADGGQVQVAAVVRPLVTQ